MSCIVVAVLFDICCTKNVIIKNIVTTATCKICLYLFLLK
jgi:hypothetical protein